ncbi:hypothetical protein HYX10_03700 [Candidatus Woesearchaeota archaeon]|nr:hypothetical protein [Candidatus Woesearchaeota archaeon]
MVTKSLRQIIEEYRLVPYHVVSEGGAATLPSPKQPGISEIYSYIKNLPLEQLEKIADNFLGTEHGGIISAQAEEIFTVKHELEFLGVNSVSLQASGYDKLDAGERIKIANHRVLLLAAFYLGLYSK